jgi:uncharacterized membrane protein YgaE (UPF0421/DUF939 family)
MRRVRSSARQRAGELTAAPVERLRTRRWAVVQAAAAAAAAWFIAAEVLGHKSPVFAPVSALIALGITSGQQVRRAVEMVVGVAIGVAVADLLAHVLGPPTLRIGVAVLLAMLGALAVGGGATLSMQAGVSAAFVAAIPSPDAALVWQRFLDSLIGGGVALACTQLLWPLRPLSSVAEVARPVFRTLAGTLGAIADALAAGDKAAAERALLQARGVDDLVGRFSQTLDVALETARLAPARRRERTRLEPFFEAARQVDLAVRNTRVLARASVALLGERPEPALVLAGAVRELAGASRALGEQLLTPAASEATRTLAVKAAYEASRLITSPGELHVARVVGQIRSTAIDLLRGSGLDLAEAQRALEKAGG